MNLAEMSDHDILLFMDNHRKKDGNYNFNSALKALGKRQDDKSAQLKIYKILTNNHNSHKLKSENIRLRSQIKEFENIIFDQSNIRSVAREIFSQDIVFDKQPEWSKESKGSDELIPILFLTDIHYGEVVLPQEIGYVNEYNSEITEKRVNQIVDDFISICDRLNYKYNGIVVPLGGDNITGYLHDLAETNDKTPIHQLIHIAELLGSVLLRLEKIFGKVFVPGVTGNHSRLHWLKTKTKGRTSDSLETLLFYILRQKLNNNIHISYNESDYVRFDVNSRRYRLEHGDKFKGGGGIGGIQVPIQRGIAKINQVANATDQNFDTIIIGHFHQHFVSDDLIIGASPKGYDEFSKAFHLKYNPPGATSWFVNAHGEQIYASQIICRNSNKVKEVGVKVF